MRAYIKLPCSPGASENLVSLLGINAALGVSTERSSRIYEADSSTKEGIHKRPSYPWGHARISFPSTPSLQGEETRGKRMEPSYADSQPYDTRVWTR